MPVDEIFWHAVDVGDDDAAWSLQDVFEGADAVIHLAWLLQPNHDEAALTRIRPRPEPS